MIIRMYKFFIMFMIKDFSCFICNNLYVLLNGNYLRYIGLKKRGEIEYELLRSMKCKLWKMCINFIGIYVVLRVIVGLLYNKREMII